MILQSHSLLVVTKFINCSCSINCCCCSGVLCLTFPGNCDEGGGAVLCFSLLRKWPWSSNHQPWQSPARKPSSCWVGLGSFGNSLAPGMLLRVPGMMLRNQGQLSPCAKNLPAAREEAGEIPELWGPHVLGSSAPRRAWWGFRGL